MQRHTRQSTHPMTSLGTTSNGIDLTERGSGEEMDTITDTGNSTTGFHSNASTPRRSHGHKEQPSMESSTLSETNAEGRKKGAGTAYPSGGRHGDHDSSSAPTNGRGLKTRGSGKRK